MLRTGKKNTTRTTFKWQTHPGSYWLEIKRASFRRLDDIRTFHIAAFGDEIKKLFVEIEEGYIEVLSSVRNLIVHKRGYVDVEFLGKIQRFPAFNDVTERTLLLLDGEQVKKMRDAAMNLGRKLIQVADAALLQAQA